MAELGKRYLEIVLFQRVTDIGVVSSHVLSAFIQTPHRFANKRKLWRNCGLGIRQRSSAGNPLAYPRLDRTGTGVLKAASYHCWLSSLRTTTPIEVSLFCEALLRHACGPIHARLNTQRKVLAMLWTNWKNDEAYNPNLFIRHLHPWRPHRRGQRIVPCDGCLRIWIAGICSCKTLALPCESSTPRIAAWSPCPIRH